MKRFLLIITLFIFIVTCEDDSPRMTIPYAPVNFTVDLNGYDYTLKEAMSYKIFTEPRLGTDRLGYAGLLVVGDATGSTIYAYDLCCPYEDDKNIRVTPRLDGKAQCPECNSLFITMFGYSGFGLGTSEEGPSTEPLQSYRVISLQPDVYRITN